MTYSRPRPQGFRDLGAARRHRVEAERDQLAAAIERVRALHQPVGVVAAAEAGVPPECAAGCGAHPCATIRALPPQDDDTTEETTR